MSYRRVRLIESPDRMGGEIYYKDHEERFMRDPELREAFEAGMKCGKKKGWREAMEEAESYHERGNYGGGRTYPPMYRNQRDWEDDDDDYMERRRRDSRGRYM